MKKYYTEEGWQRVLNAHKRGAETLTLQAKTRREEYLKNPKHCKQCRKIIPFEKRLDYSFCSSSCSAIYNNPNRKKIRICLNCEKELKESAKKYCSIRCQWEYNYKIFIPKWLSGEISGNGKSLPNQIRRWLSEQHGEQCWKCSWKEINSATKRIPLQVHHLDGHYTNNRPENLVLLCPNCHSLTETYGSLNNGNGRIERYHK